jgi:DNA mismatch repair protein MutL
MNNHHRNMLGEPARIHRLSEAAANRIAAGEVVERPASAVKELVENAIDAGAGRIEIAIADGGKTLIRVSDDGCGIAGDDLALALERHATSKIDGSDLVNIVSYGFRGEALPSMGAVARLTLTSRSAGAGEAWEIEARAGDVSQPRPAARGPGTTVELRDLFCATPARLKFLRTDRAETTAISDVVKRLAMAEPGVGFTLRDVTAKNSGGGGEGRSLFRVEAEQGELFDARLARIDRILGGEFAANALAVEAERDGLRLTGFAGLPTLSRGAAVAQHFIVNGRPVRDKLLVGALPRLRARAGRCERPPGQGRGPVPRAWRGARVGGLGAAPRVGRSRAPGRDHGLDRGAWGVPARGCGGTFSDVAAASVAAVIRPDWPGLRGAGPARRRLRRKRLVRPGRGAANRRHRGRGLASRGCQGSSP